MQGGGGGPKSPPAAVRLILYFRVFLIIYGFLEFFKCIFCINCYDHVIFLLSLLLCFVLVAL